MLLLLRFFFSFFFGFFPGRYDTSGSMIARSVPEIEGVPLSLTEKEKDWSWSILVVGFWDYIELSDFIELLDYIGLSDFQIN